MATTITYKGSSLTSFSNNTKTLKTSGKYLEDDITVSSTTVLGTTTVIPSETTQTINPASGEEGLSSVSVAAITNTYVGSSIPKRTDEDLSFSYGSFTGPAGYYSSSLTKNISVGSLSSPTISSSGLVTARASLGSTGAWLPSTESPKTLQLPTQAATTVIPSETAQTLSVNQKYMTGDVTVAGITPTYVGSSVPQYTPETDIDFQDVDLYFEGLSIPAGYYSAGDIAVPNARIYTSISVSETGLITSSNLVRATGNAAIGAITTGTRLYTLQMPTISTTTFTPSTVAQTVPIPDGGAFACYPITVEPIPSEYVIPAGTITLTANTTTVDVTQYANAEVDVPNTHTITITGGDPSAYSTYIQLNPDVSYNNYHDPGTIKFQEGDHLRVYCSGTRSTSGISVNGISVAYSSFNPVDYEFDLPNCDITVDLQPGSSSRVYITIPELEIVSNGQYIMSGYGLANVTIPISAPEGTITITTNGTHTVSQYAYADVNVTAPTPQLQHKTFQPSETSTTITYDSGYDGLARVQVYGITSTYVGSSVTRRSSSDLYAIEGRSSYIITAPSGYYATDGLYNITKMDGQTVTPTTSQQTIQTASKYLLGNITISAIPSQYIVPSGTYTISSVDSTTTFNVTQYANAQVTITDADNIAY